MVIVMRLIGMAGVLTMPMMVVPVGTMGMVLPVTSVRIIGGRGSVHRRMTDVTIFHAHCRSHRRQAGNRRHQHPAQQLLEDPFHVSRNLVSRGGAPR